MQILLWAVGGAGFPFLMTALGAAVVFFFKERISSNIQRIFLGFAAGVMIAASVWSLLIPAIEEAESAGQIGWIPAAGGFLLGIGFLMLLDYILPHLHPDAAEPEGPSSPWKRSTLLVLAVTLHNIPEGKGGVHKTVNSHSSMHCCDCSCILFCYVIVWDRTDLQIRI